MEIHQLEESVCLYSNSNQWGNKKMNQWMIVLFKESKFHHVDMCKGVKSSIN